MSQAIITVDVDLDAVDDNGIAASQTPAGAGALTLDGALGTSLDYARILGIYSASDVSNRTFTVVGTNANGESITEVITGPNNTTVVSTLFYKTITSITISGAAAGAVIVGTVATTLSAASRVVPLNYFANRAPQYIVDVAGTINYTIQESFSSPVSEASMVWLPLSAHTAKTADTNAAGTPGAVAMRVLVNSYSSGAELQCYVSQGTVP